MSPDLWPWIIFNALVLGMLALDLGVFHRKSHVVEMREALTWSGVWIALALLFNGWVYYSRGPQAGIEFFTGYLIEKSLSVDNVFVFALIFAFFKVPPAYQHRVLFWGIIGALVFRAALIAAGVTLIQRFHWMVYVFGVFLIITGVKMWLAKGQQIEPERNPLIRLFRRMMPVTPDYSGDRFFVVREGRWWATPLFVALLFVEMSDLIFAVDSIPAILAITQDPYIVYTSNVFAILGLRALYFALAGIIQMFHLLHYGLSVTLVFVGSKMLLVDFYKIPVTWSLAFIATVLGISVLLSLLRPKQPGPGEDFPPQSGLTQGE